MKPSEILEKARAIIDCPDKWDAAIKRAKEQKEKGRALEARRADASPTA